MTGTIADSKAMNAPTSVVATGKGTRTLDAREFVRLFGRKACLCASADGLVRALRRRNPGLDPIEEHRALWSAAHGFHLNHLISIMMAIGMSVPAAGMFGLFVLVATYPNAYDTPLALLLSIRGMLLPMGPIFLLRGLVFLRHLGLRKRLAAKLGVTPILSTDMTHTLHEPLDAISRTDAFQAEHILRRAGFSEDKLSRLGIAQRANSGMLHSSGVFALTHDVEMLISEAHAALAANGNMDLGRTTPSQVHVSYDYDYVLEMLSDSSISLVMPSLALASHEQAEAMPAKPTKLPVHMPLGL